MSKKVITGATLVLTICFILLGVIFKSAADSQRGVSVSTGIMLNGKYTETSSGKIGANNEKYQILNKGGTMFYILSGVTGIICIVSVVLQKKNK